MTNVPGVSIIVPVYNASATLAETLRSALEQTWRDFELIIVDDGATDDSLSIARGFTDSRIRIVRQANKGLNGARNTGIRSAKADIVAFLDADDLWAPEMLERHVAHLNARPEVGISYSPSILIDGDGRRIGRMKQSPKLSNITARDVICRNPLGNGSAGVFRRAVFDGIAFESPDGGETWWFDERFRQSTDIECWMRIVAQTDWVFAGLARPLTFYRIHGGGLSANTARQLEYWERALSALQDIRPDLAGRWGRLARAYQLRYLARRAISARDGKQAWALTHRALREDFRILSEETVKTVTTFLAASALLMYSKILERT